MLDAGAGRGKLASPVRSHLSFPRTETEGRPLTGLSCSSRVGFRPLLIQAQPFCPASRCDPHSPTTCCSPALACREKGRRNCGAADGACVSAFGWTRGMIGPPQAAMFLG